MAKRGLIALNMVMSQWGPELLGEYVRVRSWSVYISTGRLCVGFIWSQWREIERGLAKALIWVTLKFKMLRFLELRRRRNYNNHCRYWIAAPRLWLAKYRSSKLRIHLLVSLNRSSWELSIGRSLATNKKFVCIHLWILRPQLSSIKRHSSKEWSCWRTKL